MLKGFFDLHNWICEGDGLLNITNNYAEIKKEKVPLARLKYGEKVDSQEKTYKFSVECETEGNRNEMSAYAMVSMRKADGSSIKRIYAKNSDCCKRKKECTFCVPSDCTEIEIELGLKGKGYVKWTNPRIEECDALPKRPVKIACTRLEETDSKKDTIESIRNVVDKAGSQHVDVILMSECINDINGLSVKDCAETVDGTYCSLMKEKAREYNTYIVMNFHEKDSDGIYNTSLLIDRSGEIAGKYRKTHISFGEWEKGVTPGEELPVFETDFGKVAMLICWDMYFPETARVVTLKGAELILVSTVGDPAFRHVSRAMENGVYVAVSGSQFHNLNNCGIEPSKIIAPNGKILAQTNEIGGAAIAEIDLSDKGEMYWLSIPASYSVPNNIYTNERRPELYKGI